MTAIMPDKSPFAGEEDSLPKSERELTSVLDKSLSDAEALLKRIKSVKAEMEAPSKNADKLDGQRMETKSQIADILEGLAVEQVLKKFKTLKLPSNWDIPSAEGVDESDFSEISTKKLKEVMDYLASTIKIDTDSMLYLEEGLVEDLERQVNKILQANGLSKIHGIFSENYRKELEEYHYGEMGNMNGYLLGEHIFYSKLDLDNGSSDYTNWDENGVRNAVAKLFAESLTGEPIDPKRSDKLGQLKQELAEIDQASVLANERVNGLNRELWTSLNKTEESQERLVEAVTVEYEMAARSALKERYEQIQMPTGVSEDVEEFFKKHDSYTLEADDARSWRQKPKQDEPTLALSDRTGYEPFDSNDIANMSSRLICGMPLDTIGRWDGVFRSFPNGGGGITSREFKGTEPLTGYLLEILKKNCEEIALANGRELSESDIEKLTSIEKSETGTLEMRFMGEVIADSYDTYHGGRRIAIHQNKTAIRRAGAKFLMTVLGNKPYGTWETEHAKEINKAKKLMADLAKARDEGAD